MATKRKHGDENDAAIANKVADDDLIHLDREGDVILVVSSPSTSRNPTTKKFLADSGHLILASRYFEARFKTIYGEGQQVKDGRCPEIPLRDDDVEAMEIILHKLHHIHVPAHRYLDVGAVEAVARQCDKYDLTEALGGWMYRWVWLVRSAFETMPLKTIVYIVKSLPHKFDAARHGGLGDWFEPLVAKTKNITNFMQGLPSHFMTRDLKRNIDLSRGPNHK